MTTFHIPGRPIQWISTIFFIFILIGCGSGSKEKSQTDTAASGSNTIPVEVAPVARQNLSVTKIYSGTLEGEEQANIVAKISERITGIKVHVGESAGAGTVILMLDKSGVTSQYYQAEAGYKNAAKTLERMKSLYSEGAISLQALDGTQTQFDVAKANFDAARSAVELTTPISGVVIKGPGRSVKDGEGVKNGEPIVTVLSTEVPFWISASVSELSAGRVHEGQPVLIRIDSVYTGWFRSSWLHGKVDKVGAATEIQANESSPWMIQQVPIRITFDPHGLPVKHGATCRVWIDVRS